MCVCVYMCVYVCFQAWAWPAHPYDSFLEYETLRPLGKATRGVGVCVCVFVGVHVYVCVCCVYVYMCVCTCVCVCLCVCVCVCVYVCVYNVINKYISSTPTIHSQNDGHVGSYACTYVCTYVCTYIIHVMLCLHVMFRCIFVLTSSCVCFPNTMEVILILLYKT